MQALRVIKQPPNRQVVIDLPPGFDHAKRVEVIVLGVEEQADEPFAAATASPDETFPRRTPSAKLAGTRILGDLMAPVLGDADWSALA